MPNSRRATPAVLAAFSVAVLTESPVAYPITHADLPKGYTVALDSIHAIATVMNRSGPRKLNSGHKWIFRANAA